MDQLLDDCLVSIFRKFSFSERLKLEKVCSRWRELMPYSDVTGFSISDVNLPQKCMSQLQYSEGNLSITQDILALYWFRQILGIILPRCGYFLKEFNGQARNFRLIINPETFQMVAERCPNLQKLNLCNCFFHADCVPILSNFVNLDYINLALVVFLDQNREMVTDFQELQQSFEQVVANHPTLEQLNLAGLKFVPEFRNPRLKKLHLQSLALENPTVMRLTETCPNLVSLGLTSCIRISDFRPIGLSLHQLEKLWVNFTGFSDSDLSVVARGCPKLSQLRIDGCNLLRNFEPLRLLTNLSVLWIGPNPEFRDANLGRVARYGKLTNISATGCNITDQGIRFVANLCRNLEELSVACTLVSDEGLLCVVENCKRLKFLNVQNNSVSNSFIAAVGAFAVRLETLYIQNCAQIDETGFWQLLHARKSRLATESLPQLTVMTGRHAWGTVSQELTDNLKKYANVILLVITPLLALPAATET